MTAAPASGTRVALLGLGEAGRAFGADLAAAGMDVRGWDPQVAEAPEGAGVASSAPDAVHGSRLVLSLNAAVAPLAAAREVAPALDAAKRVHEGPGRALARDTRAVDT